MATSPLEFAKIIRDPVHGYIELDKLALDLINTGAFRRLRWINQHGLAHFVYPGATITRMTHSIGVYHIAKQYFESIIANTKKEILREIFGKDKKEEIQNMYLPILEVAALLHDIGHGPFSHASEPVLAKMYKKQCITFLESVLGVSTTNLKPHECITCYIVEKNEEINRILNKYYLNKRNIISILIGREVKGSSLNDDQIRVLNHIISSNIDADRLDFVLRDSYFLGVPYGLTDVERIIRVARIEKKDGKPVLAYDIRGLSAIEHFLFARVHMYRWVFYHHIITLLDRVILPTAIALLQDRECLSPKFPERLDELAENPYEKYPKDSDVLTALKCVSEKLGDKLYCYNLTSGKFEAINSFEECRNGQIIHSKLIESINDRKLLPKALWKRYEGMIAEISASIWNTIDQEIKACVSHLLEQDIKLAIEVLQRYSSLRKDIYFIYYKINDILSDMKKTEELILNIENTILANRQIATYFATRHVEFYDSEKPIYISDRGKLEIIENVSPVAGELAQTLKVRMFFVYLMDPDKSDRRDYLPQDEAEKVYRGVIEVIKEYLKDKIVEEILQNVSVKCLNNISYN